MKIAAIALAAAFAGGAGVYTVTRDTGEPSELVCEQERRAESQSWAGTEPESWAGGGGRASGLVLVCR